MTSTRHRQCGLGIIGWLVLILVLGALLLSGYIWLMLHWAYASGERAGWVQAKAARILGLTPRQIGYALKKYEVEIKRF